ncbi:hypothetical protein EXN66_Car013047 [Channa argus]|uniref:Immunoglobulin subtype domain-containing protein n=1 Tax=Channa argus TaxID=215402 RepID=A0A6G1Q4D2_CHAAH|nr:hypothetical protein EXN66_Car013047 [Channa argus]
MKDYLTLTWFFFLALQDGNTGLTNPQITSYTGTEGGNITARCSFSFSGRKKLFCKGDCTSGNILIKTTNDIAQRSRYSIEYKEGFFPSTQTVMYVKLTQLKKSDSGWYMCGLARTMLPDSQVDFEIIVTEASTTSEPKTTLPHFTTLLSSSITTSSSSSTTTATTTQSLSSSSGKFTPSSSSTQTTKQPESGSSAGSGTYIYIFTFLSTDTRL